MLCQVDQIARCAKNSAGALGDFHPGLGEYQRAGAPLKQFGAEKFLKLANLHRQGRLTDGAFFCRASEVLASR